MLMASETTDNSAAVSLRRLIHMLMASEAEENSAAVF